MCVNHVCVSWRFCIPHTSQQSFSHTYPPPIPHTNGLIPLSVTLTTKLDGVRAQENSLNGFSVQKHVEVAQSRGSHLQAWRSHCPAQVQIFPAPYTTSSLANNQAGSHILSRVQKMKLCICMVSHTNGQTSKSQISCVSSTSAQW